MNNHTYTDEIVKDENGNFYQWNCQKQEYEPTTVERLLSYLINGRRMHHLAITELKTLQLGKLTDSLEELLENKLSAFKKDINKLIGVK